MRTCCERPALTLALGLALGATACSSGAESVVTSEERALLATLRYDAAEPPLDPSNAFDGDPDARAFGQRLFFETALAGPLTSRDNDGSASVLGVVGEPGRVSCASCHVPQSGFVDTRSPHGQISLASDWTRRRTPTLLEVGSATLYNWDGRRDSLWGQAIGVMESARELNSGRLFVAEQIFRLHRAEYESIFGPMPALDDASRFPQIEPQGAGCTAGTSPVCHGMPGDGNEYDAMSPEAQREVTEVTVNTAKAIAAYVGQLRCGPSRFDAWLDGDASALDASEQRGAALFVGRAHCIDCHSGPNLTDGQFHNVGLRPTVVAVAFTDQDDRGAAEGIAAALTDPLGTSGAFSDGERRALPATVGPELEGAFRTPTLRCIDDQPSYMHTGQLTSLEQVVRFFDRGGDELGFPGTSEIHALDLDESERADLVAFLGALGGEGPDPALLIDPSTR